MGGRPKNYVPKSPTAHRKPKAPKAKVGAPPKYDPKMLPLIRDLSWLGRSNQEICDSLGIHLSTFYVWCEKHPEFKKNVEEGRDRATANVVRSLYHRATGYSHNVEKVLVVNKSIVRERVDEQFPPETAAASLWLKNRAGWSDKVDAKIDFNSTVRKALLELGDD